MSTVLVIGAGHNGLVAAAYLARAGHQVTVLESTDGIGGLCQTREVLPGLLGNFGSNTPHNFEPSIIADLELEAHGLRWIELETASAVALLPDQSRIISFYDPELQKQEFERFGVGEAGRYRETLDEITELGRRLDVSFLEPPEEFSEIASRVAPGRQNDLFSRLMFGSATDVVSERLRSEAVRASLGMLAVTGNFMGPSTPGSAFQLLQRPLYRGSAAARRRRKVLSLAEFAPRTPAGGMGALTRSIAASAVAAGARILTHTKVSQIFVHEDRARGVVDTDGREYRADAVLSAVSPHATLLGLLDEGLLPSDMVLSLRSRNLDGAMGKVYLGFEGVPRFAAARDATENALMLRCGFRVGPTISEMDRAYGLARMGSWGGPPIIYGLVQTMFDTSLNPPGKHVMSLSVSYAPRHLTSGDWEGDKDAWAQHIIASLTEHIPNLPSLISAYAVKTPEDLEQTFDLPGGNALHGDVLGHTMFGWRPLAGLGDYSTPIRGLFLGSVGTWPGNYVSGLNGRNSAARTMRYLDSQTPLT